MKKRIMRKKRLSKLTVLGQKALNKVLTIAYRGKLNRIDLGTCSITRFGDKPEPLKFLVDKFIPTGVSGTMYSQGGLGKSTLCLDLSIRAALSEKYKIKWLEKYGVNYCGKIFYLSAEEPDNILAERFYGIVNVISKELDVPIEELKETLKKNLFIKNTSTDAERLFESIKNGNDIECAPFYHSLQNTFKTEDEQELGLLVIDTRSRYSCAEGLGNVVVAKEVSLYEKLAQMFRCTVMILHHTNKKSYSFDNSSSAGASRGETAYLDSLRLGIHLKKLKPEILPVYKIPKSDSSNYIVVENSKQNYAEVIPPFVIKRSGYKFSMTTIDPNTKASAEKSKKNMEAVEALMEIIRERDGLNISELTEESGLSARQIKKAIEECEDNDLVYTQKGGKHNSTLIFAK